MHNHKGKKGVFSGVAKTSAALLALCILLVLISTTAQASVPAHSSRAALNDDQPLVFEEAQAVPVGSGIVSEPKGATGSEIYLIRLSDPPVAAYRGGIEGFEATNPSVRGEDKLDMDRPEAVAYSNYLEAQQADLINRMEGELGRQVEVVYRYRTANNGIAAYLTPEEARVVSRLPGVIFVQRDVERKLHTDNGPEWIGAPSIWGIDADTRNFSASLDAAQVVPPDNNQYTGSGTFAFDIQTNVLSWNITHDVASGLLWHREMHIRHGAAGAEGPVVIEDDDVETTITGSDTLSDEERGWLLSGDLYVEISRVGNIIGTISDQIRGQILPVAVEGNMGEGIIVGVIDTGINPSNPSFADIGGDGYDHENPWGAGTYVGVCDPANPNYDEDFPCNDKLIGAWGYSTVNGGDPRDYDSHGSHTASTAAGNFVFDAEVVGPTISLERAISGVAPHANIIAYAACCTTSALTAAIDQAVEDGVDVINYSIGSSSPSSVWNDFDTVGYLNAREAGIFVATSAGNDGPGDETVGSPADAPWLLSVGATTHDRALVNSLIDMEGGDTTPPADIFGAGFAAGYGPAPIVYAGDYGYPLCGTGASGPASNPWPAGTFDGEIVICDRGTYGRVEKGENLAAAGAGGMILANDAASGDSLNGDAHALPAVHITYADGVVLKAWVASGTDHAGTIGGFVLDEADENGDIMAAFSSRGANRALADIIVPSVSAPGVDIMAAVGVGDPDPAEWGFISGTSMASPHAAGAAALLMAAFPDWTPAEIQSVLMTTAWTDVLDDDGVTPATPFDMGSGRIDLTAAANAGLVLDETIANYVNANPAAGGDPKTLNLASFGNGECLINCSWTRTVKSVHDSTVTWTASVTSDFPLTVDPPSFELAAGATQVITVTADVVAAEPDVWHFAEVVLTPDDGDVSPAHFPVAVRPTRGTLPALIDIETRRDAGSQLVEGLEAIEITDLTVDPIGLAEAVMHEAALPQIDDPDGTNFPQIFFDHLHQAQVVMTEVPADTYALIYEVVESASPDLDMLVGYDANDNGVPDPGEDICQSATAGSFEYCEIENPAEGDWWAIVINFTASATPPDAVTLAAAVVPNGDNGNIWVEGPETVGELEPFDIRVFWDIPGMEAGDRYYGAISLGSDPANPGNIGDIRVDLVRLEDDVAKTADTATAQPGDTIEYTITVQPNSLTEDVTYWLTDTIPAGLTYVPGSASASAGTVDVTGNTLTWTGELEVIARRYVMTTSNDDPACVMPLANSGAYTDLAEYDIFTQAGIVGDTLWFSAFTTGAPINYWGADHTGIDFTDDGMAFFSSTPGTQPWYNESIPYPADPNNLLAMFWSDFVVVYDGPSNRGVSLANLGGTGPSGAILIEYDDVVEYDSTEPVMDFEVLVWRTPFDAPGEPEIIFAYDNIAYTPEYGTVGIENADGTDGIEYAFDDARLETITDGMAICFDWHMPSTDPLTITYSVTVDATTEGTVTNNVESSTSNPGSKLETISTDVEIDGVGVVYGVELSPDQAKDGLVGTDVSYTLTVTNSGNVADSFTLTVDGIWAATVDPVTTQSLAPGESATLEVIVTVPDDAEAGDVDLTTVTATSVGDDSVSDTAQLTTTATVDVTPGYVRYFPVIGKND